MIRTTRSKLVVSACAALAALAVIALPALPALAGGTQVVKIPSRVRVADHPPAFHGRVRSPRHACEVHRIVKMFRKESGPDVFLGKDRTDRRGRWEVDVSPLVSGAYYAKVRRREEGTAGTIFVCKSDKSPLVIVD